MIPRKIVQTWRSKTLSDGLSSFCNSWLDNNSGYEYQLYDDGECAQFMMDFDLRVYYVYERIIPGAFRADLWRACYLYKHGGVYADIDTLCFGSIDQFIQEAHFVAPIDLNLDMVDGQHNILNAFIACEPQSKIVKSCIDMIVDNVENRKLQLRPLDFSACGVLGRAVNIYLNRDEKSSFIGMEGHINRLHLLRFDPKTEYVCDENGNILFQNKNGNALIQRVYKKELDRYMMQSWSMASAWIKDDIFYK